MKEKETPIIVALINDYGKNRKNLFFKSKQIEEFAQRKAILDTLESMDRVIHHIINETALEELIQHTKEDHLLNAHKTIRENYHLNRFMGGSHTESLKKMLKQNIAIYKKIRLDED